MNLKRMLLLLALSAAISAVAGPQKVKTSVEKVTLFIDGAQVTRTRQVDLCLLYTSKVQRISRSKTAIKTINVNLYIWNFSTYIRYIRSNR